MEMPFKKIEHKSNAPSDGGIGLEKRLSQIPIVQEGLKTVTGIARNIASERRSSYPPVKKPEPKDPRRQAYLVNQMQATVNAHNAALLNKEKRKTQELLFDKAMQLLTEHSPTVSSKINLISERIKEITKYLGKEYDPDETGGSILSDNEIDEMQNNAIDEISKHATMDSALSRMIYNVILRLTHAGASVEKIYKKKYS